MITLKNKTIMAQIDELGAQISGLTLIDHSAALIDQQTATVLFPAIGRSVGDSYDYQNQTYTMPEQGFAKDARWRVYTQSATKVTLELTDNDQLRQSYPFYFHFLATFQLTATGIKVDYHLMNMGNVTMAFSLGTELTCHLATADWQDCQLTLAPEKALTLVRELDDDAFRTGAIQPSRYFHRGKLPLQTPEIAEHLLILTNRDMQELVLTSGRQVTQLVLKTADFPFYAVQISPTQQTIKFGLWNGLPDKQGIRSDLLRKEGNLTLPARDQLVLGYTIELS
ncbi:aldose epimerase family protein [Lapidilactobacillus luobeiensis]|uniref:aldose epimerase family protein n=1 Tax=Lapidilactobacillus luobeiensis TaxID=2950371 RepID=UPI0021C3D547|nr:hypothetical protein [Lapidilactobacillus luobeiensis]